MLQQILSFPTLSALNSLDYLIIFIFLISIFVGIVRGFIREALSLLGIILAFFIAIMFYKAFAHWMTHSQLVQGLSNQASELIGQNMSTPFSYLILGISFVVLFVGVSLVGGLVGQLINSLFVFGLLSLGNRLLGGAFGLVRGFLINLFFIFLFQLTFISKQTWWTQSFYVTAYQPAIRWLDGKIFPTIDNLKNKTQSTFENFHSQIEKLTN